MISRRSIILKHRWWKRALGLFLLGLLAILLLNSASFLKIFYPFPHRELVQEHSLKYQIDPLLAIAVIRTESRFYAEARSRAGARGLMQIMPETGEWIARQLKLPDYTEDKLFQPEYNIHMGIWYLSYLQKSFGGNIPQMLAAYNSGDTKVRKWLDEEIWSGSEYNLEQIPYEETRKYVERVLFNYRVYQRIYRKKWLG